MTPAGEPTEPTEPTWWQANRRWVIPVGCLGFPTAIGCFIFVVLFAVFAGIKASDAYSQPVALATGHAEVTAVLGSPVAPGWFVTGSINVNGPTGDANIAVPLSGPEGRGTLYVVAEKSAGQWSYEVLEVEVEATGERIDISGSME
ncbi:MAG: hypothetical protein GY719_36035 [bacterium]|nr:hypothetical protein [bacterium]